MRSKCYFFEDCFNESNFNLEQNFFRGLKEGTSAAGHKLKGHFYINSGILLLSKGDK